MLHRFCQQPQGNLLNRLRRYPMLGSLLENAPAPREGILNIEDRILIRLPNCQLQIEIKVRVIGTHQEEVARHIHREPFPNRRRELVKQHI